MQRQDDDSSSEEEEEDISAAIGNHLSSSLQRQIARLLAILSADERALVLLFLPSGKVSSSPTSTSLSQIRVRLHV